RDAYFPSLHLDDAGSAVAAALGAPAGTYNVVGDALTWREQMDALADALGVRRLAFPPAAGQKLAGKAAALMQRSERVSNAKFKEATGWEPAYPSSRQGWPAVVGQMGETRKVSVLARILLLFLLIPALELGLWATLAPHSFFNSFPGGGRHWVAVDGPFNEHLVRDFGAMNLALALVLVVALVVGSRLLVTTAAGAALLFAVPHFLYHLFNLNVFSSGDQVANVVSLAITVLLPIAVIWSAQRTTVASSSRASVASP
ncbi:MAG: hypothetical protein JO086_02770, partial [Acidimicrobiia bacterium]|nr:hypothetical protein [Acidimicrobiia bacterium]